ncbi:MAG TPA: PRC-barrel domain-containing protein [Woeseiaceae bacterium]|nr:PRC-barrel domain-containing protein [Woeseiaceae bacterium]
MAGLALTGGAAFAGAQEQSTTEEWDTQSQQTEQTDPYQTTDPYSTESQTETQSDPSMQGSTAMENPDLSQLSSEELQGMTIVSSTGEEIGTIEKVGYSEQHQDKVAAVNVGGFLGVGEKVIAIPLSDLQMGADSNVTTTLDRTQIEQQEEIDPSTLSEEPSSDPAQQY